MELVKIEALLESTNPQARMKAITELRHYQAAVSVPLIKRLINDKEFMVRSLVASGLGHKQTAEGYALLLDMLQNETDRNVLATAANSLAMHGPQALPHLMHLFEHQPHWLIQQSILAAVADMDCPAQLLHLCQLAYAAEDLMVALAGLALLGTLPHTPQAPAALEVLLDAATHPTTSLRAQAARVLHKFDHPQATAALNTLRQDPEHRVVGATLEGLLPT